MFSYFPGAGTPYSKGVWLPEPYPIGVLRPQSSMMGDMLGLWEAAFVGPLGCCVRGSFGMLLLWVLWDAAFGMLCSNFLAGPTPQDPPKISDVHSSKLTWTWRGVLNKIAVLYTGPFMSFHVDLGEGSSFPVWVVSWNPHVM